MDNERIYSQAVIGNWSQDYFQNPILSYGDVDRIKRFNFCVDLLESCQLPTGEIPMICSSSRSMKNATYVKTIFLTAFQAALHQDIKEPRLKAITKKSSEFIKKERFSNGLWCFFGKDSDFTPDIDDTLAAVTALRYDPEICEFIPELLNRMENLKSPSGLYKTWFRQYKNSVDLTVNANVILFLTLLKFEKKYITRLCKNIIRQIVNSNKIVYSRYYLSPKTLYLPLFFTNQKLFHQKHTPTLSERFTIPPQYFCFEEPWFTQRSKGVFYYSEAVGAIFEIFYIAHQLRESSRRIQNVY